MKSALSSLLSEQTPSPGSQEGLPYWLLWFLLCIIFLLLAFIFLRDKDLRQRLNRFFFGAKKKLIKFRLQTRLKITNRKRRDLLRELGRKTWKEGLEVSGAEKLIHTLEKLKEKRIQHERDLEDTEQKISKLKKSLEEKTLKNGIQISGQRAEIKIQNEKLSAAKDMTKEIKTKITQKKKESEKAEKDLHRFRKETQQIESAADFGEEEKRQKMDRITEKTEGLEKQRKEAGRILKELKEKWMEQDEVLNDIQEKLHAEERHTKKIEDESKKEQDELKKEIHEWERHKVRMQEKIKKIEKRSLPLFENLGVLTDQSRIEHEGLVLLYSQIDRNSQRIEEIKKKLKELD